MALPTTGITTTIVANELGALPSHRAVSILCSYGAINMWSKRKPVRDDRISVAFADVGKTQTASNGQWGISVPSYDANIDGQNYEYLRPRGGSAEPYRLGDFRGYKHDAQHPLILQDRNETEINLQTGSEISFMALIPPADDYQLTVDDFPQLDGYYLAAEVYDCGNRARPATFDGPDPVLIQWTTGITPQKTYFKIDMDVSPFSAYQEQWIGFKFFYASTTRAPGAVDIAHTRRPLPGGLKEDVKVWQYVKTTTSGAGIDTPTLEVTGMRRYLSSGTWQGPGTDFDDWDNGIYTSTIETPDTIALRIKILGWGDVGPKPIRLKIQTTHFNAEYEVSLDSGSVTYDLSGNAISGPAPVGIEFIVYGSFMNRQVGGTTAPPPSNVNKFVMFNFNYVLDDGTQYAIGGTSKAIKTL